MKSKFRHIALIGKYQTQGTRASLEHIAQFLRKLGCEVSLERNTAQSTGMTQLPVLDAQGIGKQCDLGVVVGGDGTVLGIARKLAEFGIPLVGINQGRFGFITDIAFEDYQSLLEPMLAGQYEEDSRALMQAQIMRKDQFVLSTTAMNDVVVNRGSSGGLVELRVEVDGHFVATQRADGLIIASPTGSSAYALSAGGPLLHPSIDGWVLVPIAPHTLSNRPIVLSNKGTVAIELVAGKEVSANFDMQALTPLQLGDRVVVSKLPHQMRFLHPKGWSYFDTLRKKLHWNKDVV